MGLIYMGYIWVIHMGLSMLKISPRGSSGIASSLAAVVSRDMAVVAVSHSTPRIPTI